MNNLKTCVLLYFSALLGACNSSASLPTVEQVQLDRYEGRWYDIAHLPKSFQDDCKCVYAEYAVQGDQLEVLNTCIDAETGEIRQVKGSAEPVEGSGNSRLKVQIQWPFTGDYYVLALEDDYSYAMVGSPDRESLWILSRRPEPAALILKDYLNKAEKLGFDTSQLVYTDQSCHVKPVEEAQ